MDTNQTTVKTTTDTLNQQDNNNQTKTVDSNVSTVSTLNNTTPGASANTANSTASTVSNNTTSDVSVNSANNASANSANTASITSNTGKPENEHEGKAILWDFIANMAIFFINFIVAIITISQHK